MLFGPDFQPLNIQLDPLFFLMSYTFFYRDSKVSQHKVSVFTGDCCKNSTVDIFLFFALYDVICCSIFVYEGQQIRRTLS